MSSQLFLSLCPSSSPGTGGPDAQPQNHSLPMMIDRSLHRYPLLLNTGQGNVQITNISVAIDQSVNSAALIDTLVMKGKQNILTFGTCLCLCNNPK